MRVTGIMAVVLVIQGVCWAQSDEVARLTILADETSCGNRGTEGAAGPNRELARPTNPTGGPTSHIFNAIV